MWHPQSDEAHGEDVPRHASSWWLLYPAVIALAVVVFLLTR